MVRQGVRSFALQDGMRSDWQLAVGEAVSLGGTLVVELAAWMAGWWRGFSLAGSLVDWHGVGWMACREAVSLDGQDGCEAVCLDRWLRLAFVKQSSLVSLVARNLLGA